MNARRLAVSSLAIIASLLLAACGGTNGLLYAVAPTPDASATPVPTATPPATLVFQLVIPTAASAIVRRPKYVSPSTLSIAVQLNGGTVTAQSVGAGFPNCTTGTGNVTCSLTLAGVTGANTLYVETLDHANNGTGSGFTWLKGNVLSSATLAVTLNNIAPANVYSTSLNGVPASVLILPAPGQTGVSGTQASGFTFVPAGGPVQFIVEALDVDGNPIIGAGAPVLAPVNTPAGLTIAPVANSQNLFTVTPSSSFVSGSLSFSATQIGTATSVSGSSPVAQKQAFLAVAQGTTYGTGTPAYQITILNVAVPSDPLLLATLALPSCPAGSTEHSANAVFDAQDDVITGYSCVPASGADTGALLEYSFTSNGYASSPTVLDSSAGVSLVAISGSVLDDVAFDPANGNTAALGVYTYTAPASPAPASAALTTPLQDNAPFTDFTLQNGGIYLTVGCYYEFPSNALNLASLTSFCSNGISTSGFGVAFDSSGNFWGTSNTEAGAGPDEMLQMNAATGAIEETFTSPHVVLPGGMDFDVNGTLWVIDLANGTVYGFAPPSGSTFGTLHGSYTVANGAYVRASH